MCILEKIVVSGDERSQPHDSRSGTVMLSLSIVDCAKNSVRRGETFIVARGECRQGQEFQ